MPLIEGIGDEVTQFVILLLIVVVIALAWWSTGSRPDRFRTVLIMGDPRRGLHHSVALSLRRRIDNNNAAIPQQNPVRTEVQMEGTENFNDDRTSISTLHQNNNNSEIDDSSSTIESQSDSDVTLTESLSVSANELTSNKADSQDSYVTPINEQQSCSYGNNCPRPLKKVNIGAMEQSSSEREMNRIVNDMDAMDVNILRNRRLNFFNKTTDGTSEINPQSLCMNIETPPSRGDERPGINMPRNLQKIIEQHCEEIPVGTHADECDSTTEPEQANVNSLTRSSELKEPSEMKEDEMIVKIKYLNDTMRIVKASENETLKDFKWRNFEHELNSTNIRLRLIFKGRVLTEDGLSLKDCGLYSNCVVHCLTHSARHQRQQPEEPSPEVSAEAGAAPARANRGRQRVWDLENVLMSLVSITLTIVWFCRCEYSNLFSVSASVALFGLTIFYSIAVFGLYLSDTFQNNRPQQQQTQQQQNPVPQ